MSDKSRSTTEKDQIKLTLARWANAIQDGDLENIGNLVTDDAVFWTHDAPELRGREALKNSFKPFFKQYEMTQDFELEELIISGDYAFLRGIEINRLTSNQAQKGTVVRQRAFSVLKKGSDETWQFHRGMTNLPPDD